MSAAFGQMQLLFRALRQRLDAPRRRRLFFYGAVVLMIVLTNVGFFGWVLTALQFNSQAVRTWQQTLKDNVLSLIALALVAGYFDWVVRKEQSEASALERERLQQRVASEVERATLEALRQVDSKVSPQTIESVVRDAVKLGLSEQLAPGDALAQSLPAQALHSALSRTLETHPEDFPRLVEGVLGTDSSCLIDDATLFFALSADEGSSFIRVAYTLRARPRRNTYCLAITHGSFAAETQLLTTGRVTDAWLVLDPDAFRASLALTPKNSAEVRFRDEKGIWVSERRPFVAAEHLQKTRGIFDDAVFVVDTSPPPEATTGCEVEIKTTLVLPARPGAFRWFFDNPTYVRDITFDVSNLWPERQMDFTLYPFLLGTEDYTQRDGGRQDQYHIGIHGWLVRGNGVILVWEDVEDTAKDKE